jgi:hypothetical protein
MLNVFQGLGIRGLLSMEDEKMVLLDVVNQSLRHRRTIKVNHIDHDALHFHVHHPWQNTHYHDGENDDEAGQKRVATNLRELFLYEISEHGIIPVLL